MDFHGIERRTIDDKGRLVLPAPLREQLGSSCMVSKGYERALHVWPHTEYEVESARLKGLHITSRRVRTQWRNHFGAHQGSFDPQGRVTLAKELRDYARITAGGNVVVSGFGNRIEVWDADTYDRVVADDDKGFADLDVDDHETGE